MPKTASEVFSDPSLRVNFRSRLWTLAGSMSRHGYLLALLAAFAVCALPRLTALPRVNVDEPWMMQLAWQLRTTGDITLPMFGFNQTFLLQPGYSLLVAPWMALVGSGIYEARLLSVLLGFVTLVLVYRVGELLQGRIAGLAAVAFLSMDSNFLGAVRSTRHDIMSLVFLVAGLLLLLEGRRTGRVLLFFLGGLSSGIALIFHANSYWGIAVAGVWLLAMNGRRVLFRADAYAYGLGVLLPMIPLLLRLEDYRRQLNRFVGTITPSLDPERIAAFIAAEPERYRYWYFGLVTVPLPNPWLIIFQLSIVAGLIIVALRIARGALRRSINPGDVMLLTHVLVSTFLFAGFVPNKAVAYLPHLLVGFAWLAGTAVAITFARFAAVLQRHDAVPRRTAEMIMAATAGIYVMTGVVHYQRWFASPTTALLAPYADTASTIDALLPPGPKYVIAFPTFWLPFKDDSTTTFYSVSAIAPPEYARPPIEGFQTAIGAETLTGKPLYVVFDEAHWLPMMSVKAPYQLSWTAFLMNHCRVQATAANTAYGTMASYVCSTTDQAPRAEGPWIASPGRRWNVGPAVWQSTPADIQSWERHKPGTRVRESAFGKDTGASAAEIEGPGGVCSAVKVKRGGAYVLLFDVKGADAQDLLSVAHAAALDSDGARAAPTEGALWYGLMEQSWYPPGLPFLATGNDVRLCFYSETETSFRIGPVRLHSLTPAPAATSTRE